MISNKITHLITTIERGGAEKQLLILAREQVKLGLRVEIIFLKGKKELFNNFEYLGAQVNQNLVGKNFFHQTILLHRMLKKCAAPLHAHLPRAELMAALACQKKYFVFTRHNTEPFLPGSPKFISILLSRFVCSRTTQGIAITNTVKQYLIAEKEISKQFKISVISYGYDEEDNLTSNGLQIISKLIKEPNNSFKIGAIGRLVTQKDYPTLLKAFSRLINDNQDVELYILGEGELKKKLLKLSQSLGIEKKVFWLGKTEFTKEFLSKINLFILASKYEGFGQVILEAMQAKIPILAANNSAVVEVVGMDFDGLFPVGDFEILSNKIKMIIDPNDSNYTKEITKNYEAILLRFDPKLMAKNIFDIYNHSMF
jgi:glycosyltransferase involved in cell wall biosynthesis